jgi:hypothetical protein
MEIFFQGKKKPSEKCAWNAPGMRDQAAAGG